MNFTSIWKTNLCINYSIQKSTSMIEWYRYDRVVALQKILEKPLM